MTAPGVPAGDELAPAKAVRAQIEAALTAGGVALGEATLPGGARVPAINVGPWQRGTVLKGLEVIVPPTPKLTAPAGFAFLGFVRSWQVRFINNASEPDILELAARAIAERFWPFEGELQRLEESPDTCEQMIIGLNVDQPAE